MRQSIQSNTKGQPSKVTSKQHQTLHRSSQHSYAEEVVIREENIQNSARTSQNMIRSQTNGIHNLPERSSNNNGQSFRSNGDDHRADDDDDDVGGSTGSTNDHQADYSDYGANSDYDEDGSTGKDQPLKDHREPPPYSDSFSTTGRQSTSFTSPQLDQHITDHRHSPGQSYDPKRYNSLNSTTELTKPLDQPRSLPQTFDTTTELSRKIPLDSCYDTNHLHTSTTSTQQSYTKTPNKSDMERSKEASLGSSGKDRIVEIGPDGVKMTKYSNGTVKYQFPDGTSEVRFTNGDKKTQNPNDSTLVYFYAQAKTTHTTYADGTEVYSFPTGQVCCHHSSHASFLLPSS
jgi:hypothetical protein